MDYHFPNKIVRKIYEYDSSYINIFNKSLNEIKNKKKYLPYWNISWKIIDDRKNLISSGYGKTFTNYYKCNDMCNIYNRTQRITGCKIYHYPRFIGDGM